uniref:Double zinc ribbon and ankyrin repeat-containing protein 1 n=1 Tax=Cyanistes caeruleus TaxID=156563 RepID=A0A8C0UDN8_CYACU
MSTLFFQGCLQSEELLFLFLSDTPGASIYYTLDGSKPELIRKPGYGACNTLEYKGPIILPVGKIMVKALAVTKDYRESSIVTKVFVVEYQQPSILLPVEDDDKNFIKDMATQNKEGGTFTTKPKKNRLNVEIKPAWDETSQDLQGRKPSHRSPQGPQLLASRLGATEYREEPTSAQPMESLQFTSSSAVTSQKSLASTQVSRIQNETNFLKCAHCSAPRLSEPLAHFCQKCGSPMPPVPVRCFPFPEGSQGKVICQVCGTGNPLHHKHCATCESKLPEVPMPVFGGDACPPLQGQQRKMAQCSKCNGVNQSDARFCAWCGAKPGPPPSYFTCSKCGTSNQPYARFCMSCGVYIEPPSRQSSPGSPMDSGDSLGLSQAKRLQAQVAWLPCPVSLPKSRAELTEREDKGTQTIGLFYPSSKLLEKKELELISQKEKVEKMSDHKPLLTAISPGKGYWRKQLDHVCAHVRSYAQNNLEFRTLIGEPQMGKINYATISEDDYEVTITLKFAAINKDFHPNRAVKFSNDYLSAGTELTDGQDCSQTNFGRDDHNLFYSSGKVKRTKSRTLMGQEYKLSPESQLLLNELGQTGKGRITFIEQLLRDGADPNSLSEEERPALTVAVLNKHTGAISPLVQKGADIDQQSGPHNNTALHEAVLLGLEGEECIRALLCCNASVQKKNAAGHSALDLAVAAGDNKVISLLQVLPRQTQRSEAEFRLLLRKSQSGSSLRKHGHSVTGAVPQHVDKTDVTGNSEAAAV